MNLAVDTADRSDIPTLVQMGAQMHQESSFRGMEYSPLETEHFLEAMLELPAYNPIIAVTEDGIVGFLLASVVKSYFGPNLTAQEFALYVAPEHRKTGAAKALLREYEAWAKSQGALRITVGNSAGTEDSAFVKLMESEGYSPMGSICSKTI